MISQGTNSFGGRGGGGNTPRTATSGGNLSMPSANNYASHEW